MRLRHRRAARTQRDCCVRSRATRPSEKRRRRAAARSVQRAHLSSQHPHRHRKKAPATMGQRVSLQEELINMKITSKQMVSASKKCEKNEKKYRKDVKKAGSRRPTSVPSLPYDSSPGMVAVGGLFLDFDGNAPRRPSRRATRKVLGFMRRTLLERRIPG